LALTATFVRRAALARTQPEPLLENARDALDVGGLVEHLVAAEEIRALGSQPLDRGVTWLANWPSLESWQQP
jgi:hypothetical protein